MSVNKKEPCPFCNADLLNIILTYRGLESHEGYKHPFTNCVLDDIELGLEDLAAWNTRSESKVER